MNCGRATKLLALYAGGDLKEWEADKVHAHMRNCRACQLLCQRLVENQDLLQSLRAEAVTPADLNQMRRSLFSRLEEVRSQLGWRLRLERFFLLGLRRPRFAVAGAILVIIVSATLFAQLRHVAAKPDNALVLLDGAGAFQLPEGYREWILVDSSTERSHPGVFTPDPTKSLLQNVYMNPDAYQAYKRTGAFLEGTVMVLESSATLVSVKSARFPGGWAYFRLDAENSKAGKVPESAGCLACHRDAAATDHVFTQFYPVLRSAAGML